MSTNDQSPASPVVDNVNSPRGKIHGTFRILDPQGNVKGYGTLGGEATPEQVKAIFGDGVVARPQS